MSDVKENIFRLFLFSIGGLIIYLLLYALRVLDDNTLTSWNMIFSPVFRNQTSISFNFAKIIFFYFLGTITVFFISPWKFPEKYPQIFLFSLAYILVLPLWQAPEVILDCSRYFTQAKYLSTYGVKYFFSQWGKEIFVWNDQFMFPFFFGLLFKFFGEHRIIIQLFNTVLFSSAVVFTYLIGRKLWDEERGFFGALFLLGIPFLYTQVPVIMVDVATMFCMVLVIYFFLESLDKSSLKNLAITGLVLFVAIFTKYSTPLMLFVLVIIIFTFQPTDLKRNLLVTGKILLIAALFSFPVIIWNFAVIKEQMILLSTFQMQGFAKWSESHFSTFFFQTHPFITFMAIYATFRAFKNRDKKFLIVFWFVIFILIFQLKRSRYILPLFPLFALMASYGIHFFKNNLIKRNFAYLIVMTSFIITTNIFLPFLKNISTVNIKMAGNYLNKLPQDSILVYILKKKESIRNLEVVLPILDIYTNKQLIYHDIIGDIIDQNLKTSGGHTWNYKIPAYYFSKTKIEELPVVIVSSEKNIIIPEAILEKIKNFKYTITFDKATGIYRYKNFLTIYHN